jgi:hypothetical protein
MTRYIYILKNPKNDSYIVEETITNDIHSHLKNTYRYCENYYIIENPHNVKLLYLMNCNSIIKQHQVSDFIDEINESLYILNGMTEEEKKISKKSRKIFHEKLMGRRRMEKTALILPTYLFAVILLAFSYWLYKFLMAILG